MAPRPTWTGHLRLSLVSFPVRLYPATSTSHQVSLHQIHEPTGERVRYQKVVPEHGPVESAEIVKGYEYKRGRYVTLTDEELDHVRLQSTRTIDLVQFVDVTDIDVLYYEKPHFLVPDGALAEEAFMVLREALRQTGKAALGQVVLSRKEHIAAIRPCGRGLILESLRYEDELRKAGTLFSEIPDKGIDDDQLELAKQLIKQKTAPFDPSRFVDHYQAALRELVQAKVEDREPEAEPEEHSDNVINLMEALKRSLAQGGKAPAASKGKSRPKPAPRGRKKAPAASPRKKRA